MAGGAECPHRDFPTGNFWRLFGKNDEARKRGKKMGNIEENEKKRSIKIRKNLKKT